MKTVLLSTAAVLALCGAANATDFSCSAPQFMVGRQSIDDKDTVVGIEINRDSRGWMVQHNFRNGSSIMRQEQYAMTTAGWTWRGKLKKNGSITMVGELYPDSQGRPSYSETQYDSGRVTMRTVSTCREVTTAELQQRAAAADAERLRIQAAKDAEQRRIQDAKDAEQKRIQEAADAEQRRKDVELKQKLAEIELAEREQKLAEAKAAEARKQSEWENQQALIRDSLLNGKDNPNIQKVTVPLKVIKDNGMWINIGLGDQVLTMLLDTGASSTMITNSLAMSLIRNGQAHFVGDAKMGTASGHTVPAREIVIHEVKIGDQVARNVKALAISGDVDMLLGANVLNKIGPYLIDSQKNQLIFAVPAKKEVT
jgi:clan AA aspartic protease (TIGR02281 family)